MEAWREGLRDVLAGGGYPGDGTAKLLERPAAAGDAGARNRLETAAFVLREVFDPLVAELVDERLAYDQAAATWPGD